MNQYLLKVSGNNNFEKDCINCPLPIELMCEKMGINLNIIQAVMWTTYDEGQLADITIAFKKEKVDEDTYKSKT